MPSLPDCFVEFPQRDFPRLTHFGVLHDRPRDQAPLHSHAGYEIVFFIHGEGTVQVSRSGKPVGVSQDGLLVTAPGGYVVSARRGGCAAAVRQVRTAR